MKAFVRVSSQSDDVKIREMPIPNPSADEVLVKVKAFGVGIHDRYFIPQNITFPYTIGSEGAGVISALGENVTDLNVGDKVIFSSSMQPKGG